MIFDENYIIFLQKLTKEKLQSIIDDYNQLSNIFNFDKVDTKKMKKNDIISKIIEIKEEYLRYFVMSLDKQDYEILKNCLSRKVKNDYLNEKRDFIKYMLNKNLIFQEDNLIIPRDIYMCLINFLKEKEISKYIEKWDRIYKLVDGIIIAYGAIDRKYFDIIISGIEDNKLIIPKLEYYYKKDYTIDNKKIVSLKLTNKKRINNYLKNTNYKMFKNSDFVAMEDSKYHHNIKSYKKFIKMLKSNYIFKNNDIKFVDQKIVIPYLYNSLNEEEIAKNNLIDTITTLFEFKSDKLKNKMLEEIVKIRDEFPLWEYRGFSKNEVKDE